MSDRPDSGALAAGARIAVTDDVFLAAAAGGPLHAQQPRDGLRSGLDAIMLAAAVPAVEGQRVLDAGAGAGVVGLAVARRCPGVQVTLLERERELVHLAQTNIVRNRLQARMGVVCADLLQPLATLQALGLRPETFDHVVANPPFHDAANVRLSPHGLKAAASAFGRDDLDRWLRFLAAMAKPSGMLTLVHRADALGQVLDAIGTRFGAVRIYPLFPRAGAPATRILAQGIKGSRLRLQLLPGLILHGAAGDPTPQAEAILRQGAALDVFAAP